MEWVGKWRKDVRRDGKKEKEWDWMGLDGIGWEKRSEGTGEGMDDVIDAIK
jgi:hypothetical protein